MNATSHLTPAERKTLNKAMDIILAHTAYGASWYFSPNYYRNCGPASMSSTCYFSSTGSQHGLISGKTFADHIEAGLSFEAEDAADSAKAKARRIEQLKEQLANLQGEAA